MGPESSRKKWLALLLSLIMPGLGQIYCGELLRGACFLVLFIFAPLLIVKVTVLLPDGWMLPGMGLAVLAGLGSYLFALADARRLAGEAGSFYRLRAFNSPVFYLAAWLVGTVLIVHSDQYLKEHVVEAYVIAGKSMIPVVLPGDYVLVKKPAYRNRAVQKGDVVIAVYPDDRSKALIRRIEGLPGEVLSRGDGTRFTVPHGTVMVAGTGPEVLDSATFGPVDLRDIVGRVTQIYFSREGAAVRWGRLGALVNP